MSSGFGAEKIKDGKAVVVINDDEVKKLLKQYKKIKKYMKSPLYTVKSIDGTEKLVSELMDEYTKNTETSEQ
jgi:hypothetical protein